jgi:hypothetical protein
MTNPKADNAAANHPAREELEKLLPCVASCLSGDYDFSKHAGYCPASFIDAVLSWHEAEVARAVAVQTTWQPIETCPDSKNVLVCSEGQIYQARQLPDSSGNKNYWAGLRQLKLVTHWMPLPSPPGTDPAPRLYTESEVAAAVEAEREACAKLVESWHYKKGGYSELAFVIRARSKESDK